MRGTLEDGTGITHVWVVGGPERAAVVGDSFRLSGLVGDTLDLRFVRDDDEVARMEVIGLPEGATVGLEGIWVDDGVAYADRLVMDDAGPVVVNGLRMADARAVPEETHLSATLLAISDAADALLVRPLERGLPDLRVVITPGTLARSADGEPVSLEELEFGDTLEVRGAGEGGFVVAAEVVVPRERARGRGPQ